MSKNTKIESRVRMNVWILSFQDKQLKELEEVMGKSRTALVQEALSTWFNTLQNLGVK